MNTRFFLLLPCLLLPCFAAVSCSPAIIPQSAPPPAPKPVSGPPVPNPEAVSQKRSGDWADWPITPGNWMYRRDDRGSVALFGTLGKDAIVTLRCDKTRGQIYLARADQTGSGAGNMTIRSSSALKQFSAKLTGATPAYVAVEIAPNDKILDAMSYTRGRILIEASGQQSIAIPVWSEIPKVVDDCRK
jgi:hypothetical protein